MLVRSLVRCQKRIESVGRRPAAGVGLLARGRLRPVCIATALRGQDLAYVGHGEVLVGLRDWVIF